MSISYKIIKKEVDQSIVLNYSCKNCKKINTTEMIFNTSRLVLYWVIPFTSLGIQNKTICQFCDIEIKKKKYNHQQILHYQNRKIGIKIPYWHSSLIIIILLLIIILTYKIIKN